MRRTTAPAPAVRRVGPRANRNIGWVRPLPSGRVHPQREATPGQGYGLAFGIVVTLIGDHALTSHHP